MAVRFGFDETLYPDIIMTLICAWLTGSTELSLGKSAVVFFFSEVENDVLLRTSTSKIFTSTKLSTEFSKIGIYATGTIRTKGKHANFNTKSANKTWRT